MKILMVLGRATGGIGGHVDDLTARLRASGHEVEVVTDASTARAFGWTDAHHLWPFDGVRTLMPGLLRWHRIMQLAGTVDVVHAHGHQAALVAALAVKRARPRPAFVVSLHNELPGGTPQATPAAPAPPAAPPATTASGARGRLLAAARRAVGTALRTADLVTGASADLVDLARGLGARRTALARVASSRVTDLLSRPVVAQRVRDSVRTRLLADSGIQDTGPLVLCVARLAPQKDLPTLARAAAASTRPSTWVVVGGGDEEVRAGVEKELGGIPLAFAGERKDVADWLAAAEVFVLTSVWEARALVVQEAMAAGVPVVVSRTGGLPDLVKDAGVLVPVGDAAGFARAVDRLLSDPAERDRRALAGRAEASTWDTPEAEARRWVTRYTEVLRQ